MATAARRLVLSLSALYAVAAVAGVMFLNFNTAVAIGFWVGLLCGGAALMIVGQRAAGSSARLSAVLVSLGALAGGIALFWSIVVPVAVAVVIAMNIALARRASAPA